MIVMQLFWKNEILIDILEQFIKESSDSNVPFVMQVFLKEEVLISILS